MRTERISARAGLIVLIILAVYHAAIGLVSVASAEWTIGFAKRFYGTDPELIPAVQYMLKMLGAYALFTAAVLILAIRRPAFRRPLALCLALLLSLRIMSRLLFFEYLEAGMGVTWPHNLFNVGLLAAEVGVLLWAYLPEPKS